MSEPATDESGCSYLLPTPAAQEPGGTAEAHLERKNRLDGGNRTKPTHLSLALQLLPTPASADATGGRVYSETYCSPTGQKPEGGKVQIPLAHAVKHLLPTPTTQDAANTAGPSQFGRHTPPLNTVVTSIGATTPRPSSATNSYLDDQPLTLPTSEDD